MTSVLVTPQIVPKDCFLRKVPIGLPLVQRMKFDAIRIAAEMMGVANYRLWQTAKAMYRADGTFEMNEQPSMWLDAWSIVSHCDMLRKTVLSLEFRTPEIHAFLHATKDVLGIRNAQQHFHSQFRNRASRKQRSSPLYGALTWTQTKESTPPLSGYFLVMCWFGSQVEPEMQVSRQIEGSILVPTGNIRIQAFGYELNLQSLTDAAASLVEHFNTQIANDIRQSIEETAAKENVAAAAALGNAASDMFLAFWGNFSDANAKAAP